MADPLLRGIGPSPEVLAYFRNKVTTPSFDWRDVWNEEHATAFTVAKATQLDVLESIRQAVDTAIAEGQPFAQFQAGLTPRLIALGWWGKQVVSDPATGLPVNAQLGSPHRLRIIFDANIRSANAAGLWQRIQRSKDVLPYLQYMETTSREPRDEHRAWAGQPVILPVDHPWWHTHYPPNGWQCKCWVLQLDEDDAADAGYTPDTQAPDLDEQPWQNRRSGVTEMVPAGIDPGWANNPGRTRQQLIDAHLAGRLDAADPGIRDTVLKDLASRGIAAPAPAPSPPAAPPAQPPPKVATPAPGKQSSLTLDGRSVTVERTALDAPRSVVKLSDASGDIGSVELFREPGSKLLKISAVDVQLVSVKERQALFKKLIKRLTKWAEAEGLLFTPEEPDENGR
jgi:hypothetical protein